MHDLTDKYWNQRYLTDDFAWDLGDVSAPLKAYIEQLDNIDLKILIPGAGNSYEAEFLFRKGFKNVFVLDFAEAPLPKPMQHQGFDSAPQLLSLRLTDRASRYTVVHGTAQ